ncbi:MAG TPA: right-handed parallel beta-helix repeat-containing protein, partial [Pirellulaceae bacterium]|nr:right-handed parallel beta-helix repeat-containing protein [Pirellulaceae bacterium]
GGGAPGTGGTIQNAFTGVLLANAPNVTINDLTVSSVLGNGFELNGGTTNATLSGVTVTSTGGNAIHADNVSTLNINNATVSTTSPGMAAVLIEDSSKININGGTITDPDAAVRLVDSLDVKVANATLNGSGAGNGVDVIGSDNVVLDKNTINNTAKGIYVESTGVDITTTITGNKINTATTGIDINGAVGTIYLNGGQLTPVPDPAANNVITGFGTDINAAGSYSGKLQVNGVARP